MRLDLHYKSFLKSSLTPMTPLYTGSRASQFSTKWLGIAAELSYNPYLRNGWVSVDTGVKGAVGSPLIEFSTWESEDSWYNIIIPNSFSYRFLFRGDRCVPQFLARSSVEAKEWWFTNSGTDTILNSWNGKVFSKIGPVSRNRINFNSIALANYRFWNFAPKSLRTAWSLIQLHPNIWLGWSTEDQKLRDLSINFLYLNRLVKHRLARINLYLYEKTNYSALKLRGAQSFFFEQIFLNTVAQSVTVVSSVNSSFRVAEVRNAKSVLSNSFENLLGRFCAVVFFFLEFKGTRSIANFFSVLFKHFLEELVTLFWISVDVSCDLSDLRIKSVTSFMARRLFNFLTVTQLSAYSFMSLLIHAVKTFVGQLCAAGFGKSLIGVRKIHTNLYAYKLRQLAAVVARETGLSCELNQIFLTNKISTKNLLADYAKHRGRGLRLFRRWQTFRVKKRKLNFIGRKLQSHLSVGRKKFPSGDAGFIFSRRLKRLRRALKLPSSAGQFTFLFFWSFQFFNFSQLNLKKRKFFFLAMRVAYFFKAFLRFFKFYSFYFKLLRRLDLSGVDLYSETGDFFLNVKTYCLLLFKKFTRLLANFRIFCAKIFVLKWKRSSTTALHAVHRLRRAALIVFNSNQNSSPKTGISFIFNPKRNLVVWSKFLAWSCSTFNVLNDAHELQFTSFGARKYLKYLLKLRANYLRLTLGKMFGGACFGVALTNISAPDTTSFTQPIARQLVRNIFRSGLLHSAMKRRSRFSTLMRTSFTAFRGTYFKKNNYFYFSCIGGLVKLSSTIVYALAKECAVLSGYLRGRTSKKVKSAIKLRKALHLASPRFRSQLVVPYLDFVARIQLNGGQGRTKLTAFLTSQSITARAVESVYFMSLLAAKRFLLIWKGLTRVNSGYLRSDNAQFGYERFWCKALGDVFCKTTSISTAGWLSSKHLEVAAQPRVVFEAFRKKLLNGQNNFNLKPLAERRFLSNLFDDHTVPVLGLREVLSVALLTAHTHTNNISRRSRLTIKGCNPLSLFKSTSLSPYKTAVARQHVLNPTHKNNFKARDLLNIFIFLWGSYLGARMSFSKISAPLVGNFSGRPWSAEAFLWLALGSTAPAILLANLIQFAAFAHAYFFAINSFSALQVGVARGMLIGSSSNAFLKAFFMRKFYFNQKGLFNRNQVLSEFAKFLAFTCVNRHISLDSVRQYTSAFSSVLLQRMAAQVMCLQSQYALIFSTNIVVSLPVIPVIFDLPWVLTAINAKSADFAADSKFTNLRLKPSLVSWIARNPGYRGIANCSVALRANLCRKAHRLYRWLAARPLRSNLIEIAQMSKTQSLSYLRTVLQTLHVLTRTRLKVGASAVISPEAYRFRAGKFFNAVRGIRPLKLLTYAKRIGIWPRKLRLRPKKTRVRRVYGIDVAKNKQTLLPDKNFKMPPGIFSRENYDSMNLVWDFPKEDYKFAYVNTLAKVKEWRFTRKQLLRSIMFKIRRRLKTRYFRRTFRYRRFLRKRWFRKKLKKLAYRALIRALSRLNALVNLRSIYKSGKILIRFANTRLYHSPTIVYSLLLRRFLSKVYIRFLGAKSTLKANFLKNLKLRFLFVLMRSFFKKMVNFLGAFVWTYRLVFGGDFASVWLFGKLGAFWLTAPRIYSFGASYYWDEPLYLFNTRLMSNYVAEDFFAVYCLPDLYVMFTIGPAWYPHYTLLASLPWRSKDVGVFIEYPTFMSSGWFRSAVSQLIFGASDILDKTEGLNLFQREVCGLFENCGFRFWLPARRERNRVIVTRRMSAYLKPSRKASILRLLKKVIILRSNKLSYKLNLAAARQSRTFANKTSFISEPYSFFERLPLRGAYITLFKHKLDRRLYRLLCRGARVIANLQWHSKPAPLKIRVGGELYSSRMRADSPWRKFKRVAGRRGNAGARITYRKVRKIVASRRVAVQGLTRLESVKRAPNIFAKVPRWKRRVLFRRRVAWRSKKIK